MIKEKMAAVIVTHALMRHDVQSITLNNHVYALDHWTYRDDNNEVLTSYEWVKLSSIQDALVFLGY